METFIAIFGLLSMVITVGAFFYMVYSLIKKNGNTKKAGIGMLGGIGLFLFAAIMTPTTEDTNKSQVVEKEDEEEDEVILELTDKEKELLVKEYSELEKKDQRSVNFIIKNIDDYDEEGQGIINENKDRIKEVKVVYDDEQAIIKAEEDKERKAQNEKADKEKANQEKADKAKADKEKADKAEAEKETIGQKNAVKAAQDYLNYTAFSRQGLIKQLKFEEYSNEDAVYAVDKLNVNWKKQAALAAQDYLDYSSFSRDGLIKQLEFEGYSNEEAVYGVGEVGY